MGVNWLTAVIAKETAYDEGYEAGKQAAAEQIFEDICRLGGCSQGITLNPMDIAELKEKWGVK
jgi:hypothetical protein